MALRSVLVEVSFDADEVPADVDLVQEVVQIVARSVNEAISSWGYLTTLGGELNTSYI